nr:7-deoxyloganetin glucosyltransferase-like [Ipomoea batatas]
MESEESCNGGKLQHAVCLPFPAQGHVNPMLKLAILLHHRGFHITFVNTEYNHRRLLRANSGRHSLDGLLGFQFKTIPDGLCSPQDGEEGNCTQDVPSLCDSTSKHCLAPFLRLLSDLNSSPGAPPVTCVVADNIMSFGLVAAEEIGVAGVSFRPTTACSFFCNALLERFRQKGLIPLKDSNGGILKTGVDSDRVLADFDVPGISRSNIRLRDLPTYALISNEINYPFIMSFVNTETKRALTKASAIIFHTLDSLEHHTLESLSAMCPPIYPIAPLHLLIDQLPDHGTLKFLGANLWKEDLSCLQWLDSKPPSSVVYVNFGSVTVITHKQLMEFAWGLAKSEQNFVWVIRSDGVMGESCAALPGEFYEETEGRGIVLRWCPQERVLKHRSTGAFLTHCGWNSMIESISSGVPMICWPFFADQHINCRLACAEWGVGVEIESEVDRDEVEKVVREVMDGEKGEEMKVKAREFKRKAEEAVGVGGSSHLLLDQLGSCFHEIADLHLVVIEHWICRIGASAEGWKISQSSPFHGSNPINLGIQKSIA